MPVDGSQINYAAGAAAGAVNIKPWHVCRQRRADGWRPQHLAARCSFQRLMTAFASARAALSATCRLALISMSSPRVLIAMEGVSVRAVGKPSWSRRGQVALTMPDAPSGAEGRNVLHGAPEGMSPLSPDFSERM